MLVILSGLETINKKFFAREILFALNSFSIDNHKVVFSNYEIEIYNPENSLVYKTPTTDLPEGIKDLIMNPEDGSSNDVGKSILDRAVEIQNQILEITRLNHFAHIFADPLYDFGLTPDLPCVSNNPVPRAYLTPHLYQDVINNYNSRTIENFVITGIFSKGFIDKVISDLGSENVIVINIIRNPSACYVLNEKDPAYYTSEETTLPRTPQQDYNKLVDSILTASILRQQSNVTTLKFEDILESRTFQINGVDIKIPRDHINFNGLITEWEFSDVILLGLVNSSKLLHFNNIFSSFYLTMSDKEKETMTNLEISEIDNFNSQFNTAITASQLSELKNICSSNSMVKWQDVVPFFNDVFKASATKEKFESLFPMDIFTILGYSPLKYEDIIYNS